MRTLRLSELHAARLANNTATKKLKAAGLGLPAAGWQFFF